MNQNINCSVNSCKFNSSENCNLNSINVGCDSQAGDACSERETNCCSFSKR